MVQKAETKVIIDDRCYFDGRNMRFKHRKGIEDCYHFKNRIFTAFSKTEENLFSLHFLAKHDQTLT